MICDSLLSINQKTIDFF